MKECKKVSCPQKLELKKVFFSFHIPQILGGEREEAKPGTYKTTLRTKKKTENENKDKQEKKKQEGSSRKLASIDQVANNWRYLQSTSPFAKETCETNKKLAMADETNLFFFSVSDPRHTEREDILTNSNTDRRSDSSDGGEGQRARGSGYVFYPVPPLKKTNKHCAK